MGAAGSEDEGTLGIHNTATTSTAAPAIKAMLEVESFMKP